MRLLECEAKEILSKYGIPTPTGKVVESPEQAKEAAGEVGCPVVLKAQVPVAGRGKAGGVLFAETPEEAEDAARKLLSTELGGLRVRRVLVEQKIQIKRELYIGVTVDRLARTYVAIASTEGGVDIEEVALRSPEFVHKLQVDPILGFQPHHARILAKRLGYRGQQMLSLAGLISRHYRVAEDCDAVLSEINPLVETVDGQFIAVDAHIIVDDSALYRHPELRSEAEGWGLTERELEARKAGLAYVELDGDVGVIGNGAGLVMATLDMVKLHGGRPANFLDVGGGAQMERVAKALEIVNSNPRVKVVLINILGGITRCDEVARGIVEAQRRSPSSKPMVVRLMGTMEDEGRRILAEEGIEAMESMEEAARRAVELAFGGA